tara:strand:+ start:1194 stop:2267 length:1074 start_codon:yes stop_codon:yes gene_type:complete
MKTYIKFLTNSFLKSFFYIILIIFSLVFLINLLTELEFFKNIDINVFFTIYLSLLTTPSMVFEIFPFILLISTQIFFIKLFNNNEIQVFKYSGLKNSKILFIISLVTFVLGLLIITFFYNTSSNLKNLYLELKSNYTVDGKYLAVINKNGLWIRDKIKNKILIINSSKIEVNNLLDNFITEFDNNYRVIRNIKSKKIDITSNDWIVVEPEIFEDNFSINKKEIIIETNYNYKRIQTLFSNLTSLSILELIELKKNYNLLNYSTIDIDIHIQKIVSYPLYLTLMTIFSALIMFSGKKLKSNTLKISLGLFLCVIIYYLNNLFSVLGATERINHYLSVWVPLILLFLTTLIMMDKINEK